MSVNINASAANISFATNSNSSIVGLTQKSILTWFTPVSSTDTSTLSALVQQAGPGTNENTFIQYNASSTPGRINFGSDWTVTTGQWRPTSDLFTDSVPNHLAITYDAGATTNDPIIYLNGTSVAVTEAATPAGTWDSGTNSEFYLGTFIASTPNCVIHSFCYYNRILAAGEIADAYASRLAIPTRRGLVFAPQLWQRGEAGQDGTLTASHTFACAASGVIGTPANSPKHKQDAFLTIQG